MKTLRSGMALLLMTVGMAYADNAPVKIHWMAYKSNLLNLTISVPAEWKPAKMPNALAFRYEDLSGGTAAIGILKSAKTSTIEEAADQEFEREGRPTDWQRTPATVDGHKALKTVGLDPKNADHKIVHYYVESPSGTYLIQCQASAGQWDTFSPTFAEILTKLKFAE